eukprot:11196725-Lingulodinium_polyedra.AAC.1
MACLARVARSSSRRNHRVFRGPRPGRATSADAAKTRQRATVHALRALAVAVGLPQSRRKPDLSLAEFEELRASVVDACDAGQKRKADEA